jgi:hypothetical protein
MFGFSQNYVDLLKVNLNTTPNNTFDSSSVKTKVNEVMVDFTIPIKLNEKTSLITGLIYENIQTKLFEEGNVKSFGSSTLKLGINNKFNEKLSGTLVLLPKIASDFKSIGNKDFQVGAIGILKIKKHDNLNYKIGLYYNSELFGPFFVPMFGFYYLSPNKKFEANVMLPLQGDVNYKIIPFMSIGCNYNGLNRSYHLNDYNGSYVSKFSNELYAYLKFDVTKKIIFQTKVGQSLGRKYKVYDENDKVDLGLPLLFIGDHRKQINTNFSNGLIFQFSFFYRFNLEKNKQ